MLLGARGFRNVDYYTFADLTHTTVAVDANCFPLGCGFIAAYAKKHLSSALNIDILKYPDDFTQYLDITLETNALFIEENSLRLKEFLGFNS